jgi:hypothetical protein
LKAEPAGFSADRPKPFPAVRVVGNTGQPSPISEKLILLVTPDCKFQNDSFTLDGSGNSW